MRGSGLAQREGPLIRFSSAPRELGGHGDHLHPRGSAFLTEAHRLADVVKPIRLSLPFLLILFLIFFYTIQSRKNVDL